jgi:hypothetical protein
MKDGVVVSVNFERPKERRETFHRFFDLFGGNRVPFA